MCSISVSYGNKKVLQHKFLNLRGPDNYNSIFVNNFTLDHYLLSMTGDYITQPKVDGDIACLFNGEIYNYKDFAETEIDAIIESYNENGEDFLKFLDGEFAIVLIDFRNELIFVSSDVFGIKPIHYTNEPSFAVCSYETPLLESGYKNIKRVEPNTTIKFNFDFKPIATKTVYDFNLDQNVKTFDIWTDSFFESINKRFSKTKHGILIPLSSGHDSGAIACAMNEKDINYVSYSYARNEFPDIIKERALRNKKNSYVDINQFDQSKPKEWLKNNCEHFYYGHDYTSRQHDGFVDPGALGLVNIISFMKENHPEIKILASGQGGDEVTSTLQTYKFRNPNPSVFTEDLESVFPWDNFYKSAQSSYLSKEEFITGSFGYEGRYPFLDKKVVQSFLNLTPHLKNKTFKSPIVNFLLEHNYPIPNNDTTKNIKRGFNP